MCEEGGGKLGWGDRGRGVSQLNLGAERMKDKCRMTRED